MGLLDLLMRVEIHRCIDIVGMGRESDSTALWLPGLIRTWAGWHFRGELSIVVVLDWECGVRCHWRLTAGTVTPLFRALLWLMC